MCGDKNQRDYPECLHLNGRKLPFVSSATNLGHTLSQDCTMDLYRQVCNDTRDILFYRADPNDTGIRKVLRRSLRGYALILWRCGCGSILQVLESLHQAGLECSSILLIISSPIRHKIMSRYVKFFSGLLTSCSPDVSLMANHDGWNKSSTTVLNLGLIVTETSLNTWSAAPASIPENLSVSVVWQRNEWSPFLLDIKGRIIWTIVSNLFSVCQVVTEI